MVSQDEFLAHYEADVDVRSLSLEKRAMLKQQIQALDYEDAALGHPAPARHG